MREQIDKLPSHTRIVQKRKRGHHMTVEERKKAQDAFIKALENTANVRAACMAANVSHTLVYQWSEHDEEFSIRFKQANTDANWILFGEGWRRAVQGEEEYVISMGKLVYGPDGQPLKTRKKSDTLLALYLKARLPEFREKQQIDLNAQFNTIAETAKAELLTDLATTMTNENKEPTNQQEP